MLAFSATERLNCPDVGVTKNVKMWPISWWKGLSLRKAPLLRLKHSDTTSDDKTSLSSEFGGHRVEIIMRKADANLHALLDLGKVALALGTKFNINFEPRLYNGVRVLIPMARSGKTATVIVYGSGKLACMGNMNEVEMFRAFDTVAIFLRQNFQHLFAECASPSSCESVSASHSPGSHSTSSGTAPSVSESPVGCPAAFASTSYYNYYNLLSPWNSQVHTFFKKLRLLNCGSGV